MRALVHAVCLLVVVMLGAVHAAPRKVLLLPLDGSVDPGARGKLNQALNKAARGLGSVTVGDTTFDEAATAIGCSPSAPTCAEHVRKTLGYDVIVWGTVSSSGGKTVLIIKRQSAGGAVRAERVELEDNGSSEKTDEKLQAALGGASEARGRTNDPPPRTTPRTTTPPSTTPTEAPVPPVDSAPAPLPAYDNRKRNMGIAFASVGAAMLLGGLLAWNETASTQDDIDTAPTQDAEDFQRLEDLESRARNLALLGNILVVGGLAAGGYGGWVLYQDRKERRVVVTPSVTPTAATVMIGGRW